MREFWIKHAAFARSEDRARALICELASLIGDYKDSGRAALEHRIQHWRRYPVHPWQK